MSSDKNYISINKELWNKRTAVHVASSFYDVEGFLKGKSSLNAIELNLLGDVKGKSILHLQCHFGQDTISLARMGAEVTGVDFSDKAVENARLLAEQDGAKATFICCNLYDLPAHLDRQFDMVFTSYGTIGWLPDLDKWAYIVSKFLKPGGQLVFVEFHPVVWMFDNDFQKVAYSYFNKEEIIEKESGSYGDRNAPIETESVSWNHSISEVVNSLLKYDLDINSLDEFDYSPYNCFNKAVEYEPGKFRIEHLDDKIPMVYAIKATKRNAG